MNENKDLAEAAGSAEDRKKTFARRALIQAGWAIPAAAMIAMPSAAGAASAHGDSGGAISGPPGGHADITNHNDVIPGHSDAVPHFDFTSGGHADAPSAHLDNGVQNPPHGDT